MAKKIKNTEKSTFVKAVFKTDGISTLVKNLWIFLLPVFILLTLLYGYQKKQKDIKIAELESVVYKQQDSIANVQEVNNILNNQVQATRLELAQLQIKYIEIQDDLKNTNNKYKDINTDINKELTKLRSDLYSISTELIKIQNKLQGSQKQGKSQ